MVLHPTDTSMGKCQINMMQFYICNYVYKKKTNLLCFVITEWKILKKYRENVVIMKVGAR